MARATAEGAHTAVLHATGETGVTRPKTGQESPVILRFTKSEIWLHWSIAVPFLVCYLSALVLVVVYYPHAEYPFRWVFSWIHRTAGICLFLLPLTALLLHRGRNGIHLYNIKEAITWRKDDFKWVFLMGLQAHGKEVTLPEQGKFNAAEKINFMAVTTFVPLFILTGTVIWWPGVSTVSYVSWYIHFHMALLMTPLMCGHIFMATVNPDTRVGLTGMISGYVDREWAKHHYRRWYREFFEVDTSATATATATATELEVPEPIRELEAPAEQVQLPTPPRQKSKQQKKKGKKKKRKPRRRQEAKPPKRQEKPPRSIDIDEEFPEQEDLEALKAAASKLAPAEEALTEQAVCGQETPERTATEPEKAREVRAKKEEEEEWEPDDFTLALENHFGNVSSISYCMLETAVCPFARPRPDLLPAASSLADERDKGYLDSLLAEVDPAAEAKSIEEPG